MTIDEETAKALVSLNSVAESRVTYIHGSVPTLIPGQARLVKAYIERLETERNQFEDMLVECEEEVEMLS